MPRSKTPWKRFYHVVDVLSASQAATLAKKFDLSISQVKELQNVLIRALYAFVLTYDSGAAKASERKGRIAFEAAVGSLDDACRKTDVALETLRILDVRSDCAEDNFGEKYSNLIESLEIARAMTGRALARLLKASDDGLYLSAPGVSDGRHKRDIRRVRVCQAIIDYWEGIGREIKYSTTKKKGDVTAVNIAPNVLGTVPTERTGELVNFILDVSGYVTEPSTPLPRETIRNEIKDARAQRKAKQATLANLQK